NRRKARFLARAYDELEQRIDDLAHQEEVDKIRPDLDGNRIMQILGIGPGPEISAAYRFLLDLRMEHGPLRAERAETGLRAWWQGRTANDPDVWLAPRRVVCDRGA